MSDHTTSDGDTADETATPETLAVDESDSAAQRESLTLGDTAPAFLDTLSDGPRDNVETDETVSDESDDDTEDTDATDEDADADAPVEGTLEAATTESDEDGDIVPTDLDPIAAFKEDLASKFGDWYVIHSYAGYENRVKTNLETRIQSLNMEDFIFEIEVPMEEVTEIKGGQRKLVRRVRMP
ncbi:MAG: transcription termination/antitermination NusG family protein, partial [Knoellia sp.]